MAERLLEPTELRASARGRADRADRLRHRRLRARRDLVRARLPSHETPPETMAQAVLASAAISALVLPLPVGDRIATDGGWVRNFPLGRALERRDRARRRLPPRPAYPRVGIEPLDASGAGCSGSARSRRSAPDRPARRGRGRAARGEPVHLGDMIIRLMRVAIQRNTALEEQLAAERDGLPELEALRADLVRLAHEHARPGRRTRARRPSRNASPARRCPGTCPRSSSAALAAPTASSTASARAPSGRSTRSGR